MNNSKATVLFTALGDIDDKYIADAFDETPHKNSWYLRPSFLGISAACFCLVAVITAAMIALGGSDGLKALFGGYGSTSSQNEYKDDNVYNTLIFDKVYKRAGYITDMSVLSDERIGKAETTDSAESKEYFEVFRLNDFSSQLCIAVKLDNNTFCCYVPENFGCSLTVLMNCIQNTDAIQLNSVSTAFSTVKEDGSHSELLYKGMTTEMLKKWLSNKENFSDESGTEDDSPVLFSFDLSVPALDKSSSSITLTLSEKGTVNLILGDQHALEYKIGNIGKDITETLYEYIITQFDAYNCEYTADHPDEPVLIKLPDDREFVFTGYITHVSVDESTKFLSIGIDADYLDQSIEINGRNYIDIDSLKVGKRVRLYNLKSSDISRPSGYSIDVIS